MTATIRCGIHSRARAAAMGKKVKVGAPDEEGSDAGPREEDAGDGPCDAHGTERGEARKEDRETGDRVPQALAAGPTASRHGAASA